MLGICNGFQVLCESHLLPGALIRNRGLRFINRDQRLRIARTDTAWTADLPAEVTVPVKNGEGAYVADSRTLDELEGEGRVVAYYVGGNPNGCSGTSPASATRRATSSGSCRTRSTRWST